MRQAASAPSSAVPSWTRWDVLALATFSAVYFLATLRLGSSSLVSYNEFFTIRIASLPTFAAIYKALAKGMDNNPPFLYFATHVSMAAFGSGWLAIRLASIGGYYVACVALFALARAHMPTWWAAIAMWLLATSRPYNYAYDARPYACVLAFGALALLSCQSYAATGKRRYAAGAALSLAAASESHFYGSLLFLPILAAEAARSWQRRRVDRLLIAVLGGTAAVSLATELPIARAIAAFAPTFAEQLSPKSFYWAYFGNLGGINAILPAVVLGLGLVSLTLSSRRRITMAATVIPDVAAGLAFLSIPIAAAGLSWITGAAYADRYTILAVLAIPVLVPHLACACRHVAPILAPALVLGLALLFAELFVRDYLALLPEMQAFRLEMAGVEEAAAGPLPLVVQDPLQYMRLDYYASPDLRSRLVYLRSPDDATAYFGGRTTDPTPALLATIGASVDRSLFLGRHTRFLVLTRPGLDCCARLLAGTPVQIHPTRNLQLFLLDR